MGNSDDDRWADNLFQQQDENYAKLIDKEKKLAVASGKEKFDIKKLNKYWTLNAKNLSGEDIQYEYNRIEQRYYTLHRDILTVKDYAMYLSRMDNFDVI
jgi:hypothetical protein